MHPTATTSGPCIACPPPLQTAGHKGKKSRPRGDGDDDNDDGLSSASFDTNDTYGSGIDIGDANGSGSRSESSYPAGGGGGGGGEEESKAVEDFKDAVYMLTEKRCVAVLFLFSCRRDVAREIDSFAFGTHTDLHEILLLYNSLNGHRHRTEENRWKSTYRYRSYEVPGRRQVAVWSLEGGGWRGTIMRMADSLYKYGT